MRLFSYCALIDLDFFFYYGPVSSIHLLLFIATLHVLRCHNTKMYIIHVQKKNVVHNIFLYCFQSSKKYMIWYFQKLREHSTCTCTCNYLIAHSIYIFTGGDISASFYCTLHFTLPIESIKHDF